MNEKYEFWLTQIKYIRFRTMCELYAFWGSAKAVYEAGEREVLRYAGLTKREKEMFAKAWQDSEWKKQWDEISRRKIRFVSCFSEEYPAALLHIQQPPKNIYVKGELPDEKKLSVGIVGARNCTPYGRDMARMFAYRLAEQGVQIISGMARGIDGWSHQGALESGGKTYAILGSGVEVCYPPSHENLYHSIRKHGGILSEQPIFAEAMPQYFPMRNRIISGLSQGLLVVEAREKSGSLITADAALEQGKDVFVIPGRIGDELSVGCNRLIRQGAIPVLSPQDILDYYGVANKKKMPQLSDIERRVFEYIGVKPIYMEEIASALSLPLSEVFKVLFTLHSRGEIMEVARGCYVKKI